MTEAQNLTDALRGVSSFTSSVKTYLREGNTVHTLSMFQDNRNITEVKNESWDLIPIITEYLTENAETTKPSQFKICQQLIQIIAETSNPEEALLQFIEEIEEAEDDTKFLNLLKPVRSVLLRVPDKRINSLAWCFNAIQAYLNKIEPPEDCNLTGEEQLLMDSNDTVNRIVLLYPHIIEFYDVFISEISNVAKEKNFLERKSVILKFMLQILGKPLCYLDMKVYKETKSRARRTAEQFVDRIFQLNGNPFVFLDLYHENNLQDSELIKPSPLGLGVFYYLLISEQVSLDKSPKVYNGIYIFQNSLPLVSELISQSGVFCIEKGLDLIRALLIRLKDIELSYLLLESKEHRVFCTRLSKVIIYNSLENLRKSALKILEIYLNAFEIRGRYLIIYNLVKSVNHTGLIGYLITQYKEMLVKQIANPDDLSVYFRDEKLWNLLEVFCHLHKAEQSDLLELSDQIIATLNLLRYLIIRDKSNKTGIRNKISVIERFYLEPLKKGIILSRAHYELRIKDLNEENAVGDKNKASSELEVKVGGYILPDMPVGEKLKVLDSSLLALDVMDSLVCRLNECLNF